MKSLKIFNKEIKIQQKNPLCFVAGFFMVGYFYFNLAMDTPLYANTIPLSSGKSETA